MFAVIKGTDGEKETTLCCNPSPCSITALFAGYVCEAHLRCRVSHRLGIKRDTDTQRL